MNTAGYLSSIIVNTSVSSRGVLFCFIFIQYCFIERRVIFCALNKLMYIPSRVRVPCIVMF